MFFGLTNGEFWTGSIGYSTGTVPISLTRFGHINWNQYGAKLKEKQNRTDITNNQTVFISLEPKKNKPELKREPDRSWNGCLSLAHLERAWRLICNEDGLAQELWNAFAAPKTHDNPT